MMARLNFNKEPKKLPEALELARYFEKDSFQKGFYRKSLNEGKRDEVESLDLINTLRLKNNFPIHSQM